MNDDKFKYIYAFTLLMGTLAWASFCVYVTYKALCTLQEPDILTAAGANVLLGSLITWTGNVVQHYFRKAKPE
ncbi:MAG: hypothetical protein PHQ43_13375 [Dehalococcoidales bacterium]|nr:hypothetical protein [Dehalococcoidales bacterium]